MASEVFICNLALGHCGSKRVIQALDEGTTEADLCDQYFDHARDLLLQDVEWGFATAYKTLALLPDAPDTEAWEYAYDYPNDCLKVRFINQDAAHFNRGNAAPFELALNDDGDDRIIMCNIEDAEVCYTKKVTNSEVFPPSFVAALGALLATFINGPLTQDQNRQRRIEDRYTILRSAAVAADRNEGEEGVELESRFANERTR